HTAGPGTANLVGEVSEARPRPYPHRSEHLFATARRPSDRPERGSAHSGTKRLLDRGLHGLDTAGLERPAGVATVELEEVLDRELGLGLELGPAFGDRLDGDDVRIDRHLGRLEIEETTGQHVGRAVAERGAGPGVRLDRHTGDRPVAFEEADLG